QESLRLALRARGAGGGALLHAARVGEAGRGRAGRVPRRGHAPGDYDAGHRHAPARPLRGVAVATAAAPPQRLTEIGRPSTGYGEHVHSAFTLPAATYVTPC